MEKNGLEKCFTPKQTQIEDCRGNIWILKTWRCPQIKRHQQCLANGLLFPSLILIFSLCPVFVHLFIPRSFGLMSDVEGLALLAGDMTRLQLCVCVCALTKKAMDKQKNSLDSLCWHVNYNTRLSVFCLPSFHSLSPLGFIHCWLPTVHWMSLNSTAPPSWLVTQQTWCHCWKITQGFFFFFFCNGCVRRRPIVT